MDKVLVEIYIPAIGVEYDTFLPGQITVKQATELLNSIFSQLNQEYFQSRILLLCDRETGIIFNPEDFIEETRISNGSKLLLI